jgi:hypothetical protein
MHVSCTLCYCNANLSSSLFLLSQRVTGQGSSVLYPWFVDPGLSISGKNLDCTPVFVDFSALYPVLMFRRGNRTPFNKEIITCPVPWFSYQSEGIGHLSFTFPFNLEVRLEPQTSDFEPQRSNKHAPLSPSKSQPRASNLKL